MRVSYRGARNSSISDDGELSCVHNRQGAESGKDRYWEWRMWGPRLRRRGNRMPARVLSRNYLVIEEREMVGMCNRLCSEGHSEAAQLFASTRSRDPNKKLYSCVRLCEGRRCTMMFSFADYLNTAPTTFGELSALIGVSTIAISSSHHRCIRLRP